MTMAWLIGVLWLDPIQDSTADKVLEMAVQRLEEAKAAYEKGKALGSIDLLNEAGFKAEEAKIKFQAVEDVLKGSARQNASDQLKVTMQLIRLINDAKKAASPSDRAPLPPPPPRPPVEEAKPAEPKQEKPAAPTFTPSVSLSLDILGKLLSGDAAFKASDSRQALMHLLGKTSERDERVTAILWMLLKIEHEPASFTDDERKRLQDCLAKIDWKKFEILSAAEHDKALGVLDEGRTRLRSVVGDSTGHFFLIAEMAHVNVLTRTSEGESMAEKWALRLGLSPLDGKRWGTKLAASIAQSDLKDTGDSVGNVYRLFTELQAWRKLPADQRKQNIVEMGRLFRELKVPGPFLKLCRDLGDHFKSASPCKRCEGVASIDCEKCENGIGEFMCSACGGLGGMGKVNCPSCGGAGGKCKACGGRGGGFTTPCRGCNSRGRWKDKCTKCKGTGKLDCVQCKGPWSEPAVGDWIAFQPCEACVSTGFAFRTAVTPCLSCCGLGKIPSPPSSGAKK